MTLGLFWGCDGLVGRGTPAFVRPTAVLTSITSGCAVTCAFPTLVSATADIR
jgi:hypothetical protein